MEAFYISTAVVLTAISSSNQDRPLSFFAPFFRFRSSPCPARRHALAQKLAGGQRDEKAHSIPCPQALLSPELQLDQLIARLFRSARETGTPLAALRARLRQWLALQPPDHFLVVDPDEELRRIVAGEVASAVTFEVAGCGLEECGQPERLAGAIVLALPSKVEAVQQALPAGVECVALHVRSVPRSLAAWLPAPSDALIGIASRWPGFLASARTMLIAAGFHPDSLVFRDARADGWAKGLRETAAVVCDSVSATLLPKGCRAIVFPLLAESSLAELRRYQEFLTQPLP